MNFMTNISNLYLKFYDNNEEYKIFFDDNVKLKTLHSFINCNLIYEIINEPVSTFIPTLLSQNENSHKVNFVTCSR